MPLLWIVVLLLWTLFVMAAGALLSRRLLTTATDLYAALVNEANQARGEARAARAEAEALRAKAGKIVTSIEKAL